MKAIRRDVLVAVVLTGFLQSRVRSTRSTRSLRWIPASILGWGVPSGLFASGNLIPAPWGGMVPFVALLIGGVILGAITGAPLSMILEQSSGGLVGSGPRF